MEADFFNNFFNFIESKGGTYTVARAIGKVNGSLFDNHKKRGSLPKMETMLLIASVYSDFDVSYYAKANILMTPPERKQVVKNLKQNDSPINIPTEAIESWKMVEEAYKMRIEHLEGEVLYYRSVIDTLLKK